MPSFSLFRCTEIIRRGPAPSIFASTRRVAPRRQSLRTQSSHIIVKQYSHSAAGSIPRTSQGPDGRVLLPSDAQRRTIYALATPPGKGGVAVIRVSGPDALGVYSRIVRPYRNTRNIVANLKALEGRWASPEPRKMVRCAVIDPVSGEELDDGLAVFFRGPQSFTTEDVLELHIHSGRAVVSSVLNALARLSQAPSGFSSQTVHSQTGLIVESETKPMLLRPAERGEFTRRAFEGGRLDLTQAEALRDLIDADTETQRRLALRAARGSIRERFEKMRAENIRAMAMIEALIDFGEGEDIEEGVYDHARELVKQLHNTISAHLADSRRGEILRSGLRLAIFGPPNAGKSSLLNFLAGREAAIVTPVPGTTRDVLELTLDIGGLAVVVADTAGLRKTDDVVERIGVERARERVGDSDISLCVLSLPEITTGADVRLPVQVEELVRPSTYVLLNKADLSVPEEISAAKKALSTCAGLWTVSLSSGEGLEDFVSSFGLLINERYAMSNGHEEPLITNARHRTQLEAAREFLDAFLTTEDIVVAAEELRYAANAVGKVTGAIDVEDVLDIVFQEFCIGK